MIRAALPIVALVLAVPGVSSGQPAAGEVRLEVPYVSQTEALCGGAAVAMVYRYWGDARADAQQFAPLVDKRAGGIAEDDLVAAIVSHGWRAIRLQGSMDLLREQIGRGRPAIVLVEDRPSKYHYLVVTGVEPEGVVVHDPSWGPSRRIKTSDLLKVWQPAHYWALIVTPGTAVGSATVPGATAPGGSPDACETLTEAAVQRVQSHGLETADAAFADVQARCPGSAAPLRELAGVRFAQKRWAEAEALAARAVDRDPADRYGWEVLASSRFVRNDLNGALGAWNRIGQPRVDTIQIAGLTRARYETIAQSLGLRPHALLTPESLARARRRVNELPDRTGTARISFVPAEDGYATVAVSLVERPVRPRGAPQWAITAAKTVIDRELSASFPGFTGQGEMWSASWRWWPGRPRAAVAFSTPRIGRLGGIWRAEGSWESQRYSAPDGSVAAAETRGHAGFGMSDWATGQFRYAIGAAFDEWNRSERSLSTRVAFEHRFADDRLAIGGDLTAAAPAGAGPAFQTAGIVTAVRSSVTDAPWVVTATAGAAAASARAPLALWPGAGEGHARSPLLRAHHLLDDGAIGGEAFGRRLVHASAELQRWLPVGALARIGVAGFVDAARATKRLDGTSSPLQVDAGGGLRLKIAGSGGVLRIDVARGLRDGAVALSAGWTTR